MSRDDDASPSPELISLRELAPSPVDETPITLDDKDTPGSSYFAASSSAPASQSTASSLGLGNHTAAWWLNRIQRYSSYAFSAYLAAHVVNTSLIPLATRSLPASDTYLLLTRPYYQSPVLEPLLVVAPLALHVGAGLALRLHRRRQSLRWYGAETRAERRGVSWPRLSWISAAGYALVPLAVGHAFLNRGLPLRVEGGSSSIGLQYVAHGFARHPVVSWAGFTALIGVAAGHLVWGWAKWLGWAPDPTEAGDAVERGPRKRRRRYAINGVAAAVAGLWMAGGLGVVARGGAMGGWQGRHYDELYRRIPIVGRWA